MFCLKSFFQCGGIPCTLWFVSLWLFVNSLWENLPSLPPVMQITDSWVFLTTRPGAGHKFRGTPGPSGRGGVLEWPVHPWSESCSVEVQLGVILAFAVVFSGPGFAIFSVIQLLLPVMSLWLQRSHGDHSYWDIAAANFKHAIGLSCELVVEHIHSFIHSGMLITNRFMDLQGTVFIHSNSIV